MAVAAWTDRRKLVVLAPFREPSFGAPHAPSLPVRATAARSVATRAAKNGPKQCPAALCMSSPIVTHEPSRPQSAVTSKEPTVVV